MAIDIFIGIIIIWGMVRGWLHGFVFQAGQLLVMLAAFVVAKALAPPVAPYVEGLFETSYEVRHAISFFLVFFVVSFLGGFAVRALSRDLRRTSKTLSGTDRVLGTIVGLAKSGVIVYVVMVGLIVMNQSRGIVPVPYATSVSGRWVMQHNIMDDGAFPRAKALVQLGVLVHGGSAGKLLQDPHFRAILEHPKGAVLREPQVAEDLATGRWLKIVGNEAVWDLLDESEIQEHLNAIELKQDADKDTET